MAMYAAIARVPYSQRPAASQSWTVAEARERLHEQIKGPDFVYFVYVVDDEKARRLRGQLTLRDLFVAGEERRLEEIMNPYLIESLSFRPHGQKQNRSSPIYQ
jgi:Mg/Co/Ni transporter MgtE